MIPPRAASLLIDHLDSVDAAVGKRLVRKRPWNEVSLTSFLCDLLDETTQEEENLSFPLTRLNEELAGGEGVLDVNFEIETHEYGPEVERHVTQSDLGLVISYEDLITGDRASTDWLLQAKRLAPFTGSPRQWSPQSRFGGRDPGQHARLQQLGKLVGEPFVKYLLYCPRPAAIDEATAKTLAHLRSKQLSGHIFDYALGIKLHEELARPNSSLAASMFVAESARPPKTLSQTHTAIFTGCTPFSWFVAEQFSPPPFRNSVGFQDPVRGVAPGGSDQQKALRHGIVTGDPEAVRQLLEELGGTVDDPAGRFLPAHTMTVKVRAGHMLDPDVRAVRDS